MNSRTVRWAKALLFGATAAVSAWCLASCSSARITASPQAIHQAAGAGDIHALTLALNGDCNVDLADGHGSTPLRYAVLAGRVEAARVLLDHGANPNQVSDDGETPLLDACHRADTATAEMLLDHGANIEAFGESGLTPLLISTATEVKPLFTLLLHRRASPSAGPPGCLDPLSVAICKRDPFFFKQLLVAGAKPRTNLPGDNSHLHIAASFGNEQALRVLLGMGADPLAANRDGLTPLDLAIFDYHYGCVSALLVGRSRVEVQQLYSQARPFYRGVALKVFVDNGGGEERRPFLVEARDCLVSALKEAEGATVRWEEMQREESKKEKARRRAEFWAGILASALGSAIQATAAEYSYKYESKQWAQMVALRDSNTPTQYFSSYTQLMRSLRQPEVVVGPSGSPVMVAPATRTIMVPAREVRLPEERTPPSVEGRGLLDRRTEECKSLLREIEQLMGTSQ